MSTPHNQSPDSVANLVAILRQKMMDPMTITLPGYAFAATGLFALAVIVMALD